ncbi:hypothetical protein ABVK25_009340 [Lepraria finkii]|uniref:Prolactin receptor n=1 Tax=Lepraria finkii TaxID=1340010 RepID=A0ABR4AXH4_9LECA
MLCQSDHQSAGKIPGLKPVHGQEHSHDSEEIKNHRSRDTWNQKTDEPDNSVVHPWPDNPKSSRTVLETPPSSQARLPTRNAVPQKPSVLNLSDRRQTNCPHANPTESTMTF